MAGRTDSTFTGTRLFLNGLIHSTNPDSQTIATVKLRTLLLDASYVGAIEAENVFDRVTRIIVYHKDGQEIPEKNILCNLGGQSE
ncbi:hypothetical protein M758_UG199400 [Ceratodon purpureus]|nr:hypothetical protein M758_UG199400 [Ceratodon purpureus]